VIAGFVSLVLLSIGVLVVEYLRRRMSVSDSESDRFKEAVSHLPGLKRRTVKA
jgi:hypothetical protein